MRDKVRGAYAESSAIYYPSQASSPYFGLLSTRLVCRSNNQSSSVWATGVESHSVDSHSVSFKASVLHINHW